MSTLQFYAGNGKYSQRLAGSHFFRVHAFVTFSTTLVFSRLRVRFRGYAIYYVFKFNF